MHRMFLAAGLAAALVLPDRAAAVDCRAALHALDQDMAGRGRPILGFGPLFAPDRKTELRMIVRSLRQEARIMDRRGDTARCLRLVAQARDKLRRL